MKNKLSAVCSANLLNSEQIKILPKATGLFLIALSGFILFLSNSANAGLKKNIPHLPPDAPSSMYRNYLHNNPVFLDSDIEEMQTPIQQALKLGERNLSWLKYMNSFRQEDQYLRLTKPGDLIGYPIETPNKYSDTIIEAQYNEMKINLPPSMAQILLNGSEFSKDLPLPEADYIFWAKKIDRIYQSAARWTMMQPYLSEMANNQMNDVRGFYNLNQDVDVQKNLESFASLTAEKKQSYRESLLNICQNSQGLGPNCARDLKKAESQSKLYPFFQKYFPASQELWNAYFQIQAQRYDVSWPTNNPLLTMIPFQTPNDKKIQDFLSVNIEDEWKWNGWQLRLDFTPKGATHIEFQPGATPHVTGLAGNVIVMDKNTPLSEWDVQWTIRHEYGHVLGFADCYVEFYIPSEKVMMNYQLDVNNLMCSRKGRLQQKHFDEFKRIYFGKESQTGTAN